MQVHPTCVLGNDVVLGDGTVLEALVVVGDRVRLGAGCHVESGAVLRHGTRLGARVRVGSGAVLGTDGFGYVEDGGQHHKIAQVGIVEVGDDVEIGAGACIDRATLGVTRIGAGVRIGALAQVGHNVTVEAGCVVGPQAGLAGSSHLGEGVELAQGAGVAPHVTVGARSVAGFRAGVIKNLPPDSAVEGFPARPAHEIEALNHLLADASGLARRVAALEEALPLKGDL